jgi:PadR family transcriptional regulator PadR
MPADPDADVERWEAQLRKGTLELAILASLWGTRRYGLEILRALEARCRLALAEGTLYLILNRLRKDGPWPASAERPGS